MSIIFSLVRDSFSHIHSLTADSHIEIRQLLYDSEERTFVGWLDANSAIWLRRF